MQVVFTYRVNNPKLRSHGETKFLRDDFGDPIVFSPDAAQYFKRCIGQVFTDLRAVRLPDASKSRYSA